MTGAESPAGEALAGWTPPPAPTRETIFGRLVTLAPLTLDHAAALHQANGADAAGDLWRFMPYGPFADLAAYRSWMADAVRGADPLFVAILDAEGPAGVASFLRIAPAAGSLEIGHICLSPRLQRTPGSTEALSMMMSWAFGAGYRRVEWKCDAGNAASRRAAGRLGFLFEGIFRQATVVKGRNRDTAWFAAIDADWAEIAAAHALWLDPDNFDRDGGQRMSLADLTRPILDRAAAAAPR